MENSSFPATAKDVLRYVRENKVTFINLWFPDILGQLKSFSIRQSELEEALSEGMGFDGSSIEGFVRIEESDLIAKPIPQTFRPLVFRPQEENAVACMFCEIHNPDGSRFEGDSLFVLEKQLAQMEKMGFDHYYVGPELEFFLFRDNSPNPGQTILDHGTYFGVADDAGIDIRRDIILASTAMGVDIEYSHHEVAPSQHEIDFHYDDAWKMAIKAMSYRRIAKEIARQHGVFASFMPKPIFGENGSGMHVHQSLFRGSENAFFDHTDPVHLSQTAKLFIAGVIKHAREIVAITNQWVNSYQRLVPGYEAPTELSWARRNRSTAIRVPMYKPGKSKATRIEVRFPDPACNIPLAFAAMLAAGLEGIKNQYELPAAVESNIFQMDKEERRKAGIVSLPGSLKEATELLAQSELAKRILGEHIHTSLVANQQAEWHQYWLNVTGRDREEHRVTDYELIKLLPLL